MAGLGGGRKGRSVVGIKLLSSKDGLGDIEFWAQKKSTGTEILVLLKQEIFAPES